MTRKSWVMRLPPSVRDQPAWIFIGIMCAAAGLSYLFGVSESTAISRAVDPLGLRIWGGFLAGSGILVVGTTISANRPLEAFGLRVLSVVSLLYVVWVLVYVPITQASFAIVLGLILVVLAEIRIAVIKTLLRPRPVLKRE